MFLTRIPLDVKKKETMIALNELNKFHGAVESCFEGEKQRNLWRIDVLNNNYYIYILSSAIPETKKFCEQFSFSSDTAQIKKLDVLFDAIKNGTVWRFRLTANPTKRYGKSGKLPGKRVAIIGIENQIIWLKNQALKSGFSIDENKTLVVGNKWCRFSKGGQSKKITLHEVTYEGILTVENSDLFKEKLKNGFGKEKAYGMGLMTLAKV